jgi:Tol biopolymer transport system component
VLAVGLTLATGPAGDAASRPRFLRASSPRGGPEANDAAYSPAISADGRWVAFASDASNLVPGDCNHRRDIFLRDLTTSRIIRVSVSSTGQQGNADSYNPSVSADGRYVVYDSFASNLVPDDRNRQGDVFLFDRVTGVSTLVSRGRDGKPADGQSGFAVISADGSTVAFESTAQNVVAEPTGSAAQVYTWDRRSGAMEVASKAYTGGAAGGGSGGLSISADGRFVAFASGSDTLVPNDHNQAQDVFVRDRKLGTTVRVSVNSNGGEGNGKSDGPALSADGRYAAFESTSTNLLAADPTAQDVPRVPRNLDPTGRIEGGDDNFASDIFVHDLKTGATKRVSVASDGSEAKGDSYHAAISGDGRRVAFVSVAPNLEAGDTNHFREVFLHDLDSEATTRVCAAGSGGPCDKLSITPALDGDGGRIAFASEATNVVADDRNSEPDVFVRFSGGPAN